MASGGNACTESRLETFFTRSFTRFLLPRSVANFFRLVFLKRFEGFVGLRFRRRTFRAERFDCFVAMLNGGAWRICYFRFGFGLGFGLGFGTGEGVAIGPGFSGGS